MILPSTVVEGGCVILASTVVEGGCEILASTVVEGGCEILASTVVDGGCVIFLLPLHAAVLEPNFNLAFRQTQRIGNLYSSASCQITTVVEFLL